MKRAIFVCLVVLSLFFVLLFRFTHPVSDLNQVKPIGSPEMQAVEKKAETEDNTKESVRDSNTTVDEAGRSITPTPEVALTDSSAVGAITAATNEVGLRGDRPGRTVPRSGLPVIWLSNEEAEAYQWEAFVKKGRSVDFNEAGLRMVASRSDAQEYVTRVISMASLPSRGYENDEYYFFSGGTTAYEVSDFSRGIVVEKASGKISTW